MIAAIDVPLCVFDYGPTYPVAIKSVTMKMSPKRWSIDVCEPYICIRDNAVRLALLEDIGVQI